MEFLIIGLFLLAIYFIPSFIAFYRRHTYKWVILGINTFAIAAGVPWWRGLSAIVGKAVFIFILTYMGVFLNLVGRFCFQIPTCI